MWGNKAFLALQASQSDFGDFGREKSLLHRFAMQRTAWKSRPVNSVPRLQNYYPTTLIFWETDFVALVCRNDFPNCVNIGNGHTNMTMLFQYFNIVSGDTFCEESNGYP